MKVAQVQNQELMIEILMLELSTQFYLGKVADEGYFDRDQWLKTNQIFTDLMRLLEGNFDKLKKLAEVEQIEEKFQFSKISQILPAVVTFIEKLDVQLFKALQVLSQTSLEYVHRLRDECLLISQCKNIMRFLAHAQDFENQARVGMVMLEHVYYKSDSLYEKTRAALKGKPDQLSLIHMPEKSSVEEVSGLVDLILKHSSGKFKVKALCLQLYNLAIHNKFQEARHLMMSTRLSTSIHKQKIQIQINYNRALVQIGLAAFRLGLFEECNQLLLNICQSPNLKESLAQGVSNYLRQQEKTLEEEVEEKKRFLPPHLHIGTESLDSVYLATSMFQEIPNLSENRFHLQKKVLNRNYRKLIEQYDLKGIQFLPQSSRDYIVFASRNLHQSKWKEAFDNLSNIKVFQKMPEFKEGGLKDSLLLRCKQVSLNLFVSQNQSQNKAFNIGQLQEQFQLSKAQVLKVVSSLISKGLLNAKVDAKNGNIVFNSATQSSGDSRKEIEFLQKQHLEKIEQLVEGNERCMELYQSSNL